MTTNKTHRTPPAADNAAELDQPEPAQPQLSRAALLRSAVSLGLGVWFLPLAACGDDSDDGGGGGGGDCSNTRVTMSPSHGHTLVVSAADIEAAQTRTYTIQGSSPHSHEVTVTTRHFEDLTAGKTVSLTSTDAAGHNHSITVSC